MDQNGRFWPEEVHFGPFRSANRTLAIPEFGTFWNPGRDAQTTHLVFLSLWARRAQMTLAGLETQTQNAAFFERKRPKRKPWHRGKSLNRKKRSQFVFF